MIAVDRFFKLTSLFNRVFNRAFLFDRLLIGRIEKLDLNHPTQKVFLHRLILTLYLGQASTSFA